MSTAGHRADTLAGRSRSRPDRWTAHSYTKTYSFSQRAAQRVHKGTKGSSWQTDRSPVAWRVVCRGEQPAPGPIGGHESWHLRHRYSVADLDERPCRLINGESQEQRGRNRVAGVAIGGHIHVVPVWRETQRAHGPWEGHWPITALKITIRGSVVDHNGVILPSVQQRRHTQDQKAARRSSRGRAFGPARQRTKRSNNTRFARARGIARKARRRRGRSTHIHFTY